MAIKYQVRRRFSIWSGEILLLETYSVTFSRHHTCAHAHTKYVAAKFSCGSVTTMITKFPSDHNVFAYKWFLFPGSA